MFDTGLLTLCLKCTVTGGGMMPVEKLAPYGRSFFGERTVTYSRLYEARGANCQVDKLVRVPFDTQIRPDSYVVLENGEEYRVDAVAPVIVRRDVRAVELTLIRLDELLDLEEVAT